VVQAEVFPVIPLQAIQQCRMIYMSVRAVQLVSPAEILFLVKPTLQED
jgi:hypothetical protein